jgi:hypothetical protein
MPRLARNEDLSKATIPAEWFLKRMEQYLKLPGPSNLGSNTDLSSILNETFLSESDRWVYEEEQNWSSGDGDYKFKETFYDLIFSHFGAQVVNNIMVNSIVSTIDYSSDKVLVSTNSGQQFSADKVLITVPITILQSNDISFIPTLPVKKITAFSEIGMGAGMKVFMKYSTHLFADTIHFLGIYEIFHSTDQYIIDDKLLWLHNCSL